MYTRVYTKSGGNNSIILAVPRFFERERAAFDLRPRGGQALIKSVNSRETFYSTS